MISITRTKWKWRSAAIALRLGNKIEEQETRTGDDFGFSISELCARVGVERVILGHTDGTYTEYEMKVIEEPEHELEDLGYGGDPCGDLDDGPVCGHPPSSNPTHCVRMTCPNYKQPSSEPA